MKRLVEFLMHYPDSLCGLRQLKLSNLNLTVWKHGADLKFAAEGLHVLSKSADV